MLWIVNMGTSSDDASFEISSATIFWFLGTYINSTLLNAWVRCLVSLRCFYILSSFTSYSPLICSTISFESFWTNRFFTPSAFPSLNLVNMPSYLALLLVARNFSWTPYLSISLSWAVMTTPTPPPFLSWRTVSLNHPSLGSIGQVVLVWEGEFGDEIHQSLCFDGCFGVVLNIKLAKLDCPLNHSSCCLRFIHGLFGRLVCYDQDRVCLKILP